MAWSFSNIFKRVSSDEWQEDVAKDAAELKESAGNTLDSIGSGLATGFNWTMNAMEHTTAWMQAVNPINYAFDKVVLEPISIVAPNSYIKPDELAAEKRGQMAEESVNFIHLAEDEGLGRAASLTAQGGLNAVTSTAGMVSDLGRNALTATADVGTAIIYDLPAELVERGVNLGRDIGEEQISYGRDSIWSITKSGNAWAGGFMGWSVALNEHSQVFADRIEPTSYVDIREFLTDPSRQDEKFDPKNQCAYVLGEDGEYELDTDGNKIPDESIFLLDTDGEKIPNERFNRPWKPEEDGEERPAYVFLKENPYANIERTFLYGGQALIEVPMFAATFIASGGTAGALWASKGTGVTRTVATAKRMDMVTDSIKATQQVDKATAKTTAAVTAKTTTKTTQQVEKTAAKATQETTEEAATKAAQETTEEATVKAAQETAEETAVKAAQETAEETAEKVAQETAEEATESIAKTEAAENADKLISGEKGRTATDDYLVGKKANKNGATAAEQRGGALTREDLAEQAAEKTHKSAAKLEKAIENLEKVQSTSSNTRDIVAAQKAVANATNAVDKQLNGVNTLARYMKVDLFTPDETMGLTRTFQQLGYGEGLSNGFNRGAYGVYRWLDPLESPILESLGTSGSFTFGYLADQKAAAKEIVGIEEEISRQAIGTTTEDAKDPALSVPSGDDKSPASKAIASTQLDAGVSESTNGRPDMINGAIPISDAERINAIMSGNN